VLLKDLCALDAPNRYVGLINRIYNHRLSDGCHFA
jgi:hypothetical protein